MARIVIIDDDEIVGNLVCGALFDAGHASAWLGDGEQALSLMMNRRPDLVILDQHMPTISGSEVLRRMLAEYELAPVLMLTSVSGKADKSIAYYFGADDYLTKPFETDELVFRVEELVAKTLKPEPKPANLFRRYVT